MSISRACPKCGERRVVREGMFHWRGTTFSGLVCEKCNALWNNPDDSFEAAVVASHGGRPFGEVIGATRSTSAKPEPSPR